MWLPGQTQLNRVQTRVRGSPQGPDLLAVRLRAESFLEHADLHPPGLPPQALLVVRRLADPLPGALMGDTQSPWIDANWESACRKELDALTQRAVRPMNGCIDAAAESIVFANAGELLACLALALARHEAWQLWWCKALLRLVPGRIDALFQLLSGQARFVPAILAQAAEWHSATVLINALDEPQQRALIEAVIQNHELTDFRAQPRGKPGPELGNSTESPIAGSRTHRDCETDTRIARGPWEGRVAAMVATQSPRGKPAECLLGLSLSLHYRPAIAHSADFAKIFGSWWNAGEPADHLHCAIPKRTPELASFHRDAAAIPAKPESRDADEGGSRSQFPSLCRDRKPIVTLVANGDHPDHSAPEFSRGNAQTAASARASLLNATATLDKSKTESQLLAARIVTPIESGATDHSTLAPSMELESTTDRAIPARLEKADPKSFISAGEDFAKAMPSSRTGVATRFGGVFYLINLMRHLELPACFEDQCSLASRVGAWGVLDAIARVLCGELDHDLIWALLAELDGREPHELPGAEFGPIAQLRLPEAWFEIEPQSSPVYNGPPFPGNLHLRRWLEFVLPFIRGRLSDALGKEASADLPGSLLEFAARVFATAMHVDVVMALDDISLPVRRAGLDRDPAWCPEFGRVIAFHFE